MRNINFTICILYKPIKNSRNNFKSISQHRGYAWTRIKPSAVESFIKRCSNEKNSKYLRKYNQTGDVCHG